MLMASGALAAPPPGADPALHPWYESLQDPQTGGSCCGEADCRHNPVATFTGEDGATHYKVQYKGQWLSVDDDRILKREDNPTGDFVSCVYDPLDGEAGIKPKVLCLIRAPGT